MYEQRDVVLLPFPYSDLSAAKLRPALILSNALFNKSQDRICCLITSRKNLEGIKIDKNHYQQGKLPFQSWAKPQQMFTIHEKIILKKLCQMTPEFHQKTLSRLKDYLK